MKKLTDKSKILLLTSGGQDYLQDDLLYGFRILFNEQAVDYPRKAILYQDFDGQVHPRPEYAMNARYFITDPIDRSQNMLPENFDLVVNLSCRRIRKNADIYVDGEDDDVLALHYGAPPMFKRELTPVVPREKIPHVYPITFGLPDHLIPLMPGGANTVNRDARENRIHSSFTIEHGVNRSELARHYPVKKYSNRIDYFGALSNSQYVLSPKGAGWDCQRHYEILGRSVPIIEVADDAPLHFISMWRDGENCITFNGDHKMIEDKIADITAKQWEDIVMQGYKEIHELYTCSAVVKKMLKDAGVW